MFITTGRLKKHRFYGVSAMLVLLLAAGVNWAFGDQGSNQRSLGLHQAVSQWPEKAKRWALIIGVDQYKDRQIAPLRGADNDARLLAEALIQNAGFPRDQVIVLSTDQPEERQPTRVNLLRRLSNLVGAVPTDGLLLVSFAGHGIERRGQAFLLPSDAAVSGDIAFLEDTAVSVSRMTDRIAATGVSQVIVLLDACRNDPVGRSDAPNLLTPAFTKFNFDGRNRDVTAFAVLYATAVGKRAYEYGEKRQGYFTWAVTEGLKGAAANANGQVTLGGLIDYVQTTVSKRVLIDMGVGSEQRPFADVRGYRANELIISVADRASLGVTKGTDPPRPIDPLSVEITYWNSISASVNADDFEAYLKEYPNGKFANLARNRLSSLEASAKLPSLGAPDPKGPRGKLADSENPLLIGYRIVGKPTFSTAEDSALGDRLAATMEKASTFVTDLAVSEYVNRIGQNIIQHSDSKVTYTIKVLDNIEVNACAFPGHVYITKGAMLATDTEAELAGLMAHGIAHVAAGHLVDRSQGGIAPTNAFRFSVPIRYVTFGAEAEAEADMLAVQYMWAAGYDPNNCLSFFEKLNKREKRRPGITSRLFASHPPTANRVEKTHDLLSRFPDRSEYTVSTSEFNRMKSRLISLTDQKQLEAFGFFPESNSTPTKPILKRRKEGDDLTQPSVEEQPKEKPTLNRKPLDPQL